MRRGVYGIGKSKVDVGYESRAYRSEKRENKYERYRGENAFDLVFAVSRRRKDRDRTRGDLRSYLRPGFAYCPVRFGFGQIGTHDAAVFQLYEILSVFAVQTFVVADDDDKPLFGDLFQQSHYQFAVFTVEIAGRFVGEDGRAVFYQRSGDGYALFFSARHSGYLFVGKTCVQTRFFEQSRYFVRGRILAYRLRGEPQIVARRQFFRKHEILIYVRNVSAAVFLNVRFGYFPAVEK